MPYKHISSKDNPIFKRIRLALKDNTSYRIHQRVWVEGEHLCQSAIEHGWRFKELLFVDTEVPSYASEWAQCSEHVFTLTKPLMRSLSLLPSAGSVMASLDIPSFGLPNMRESMVVLDQLQDPGNAGSVLRCAAAFGFKQIVATPGTVALWSPKVLRAAMGAHFGLSLFESIPVPTILEYALPMLVTDVQADAFLHDLSNRGALPWPCAWVFGHEGQGIGQAWQDATCQRVKIDQPGGQNSLNVAAAAAICLHASATQRVRGD